MPKSIQLYETKNDGMTKEPTNKFLEIIINENIYTWTFQLDNNLLEIQKQHHGWMPQEIALAFTTKFPML